MRYKLLQFDKHYRPDLILVDGVGVGQGLVQLLKRDGVRHVEGVKGSGKVVDAEAVAPMIEGGRVFYLEGMPGLVLFRDEVIAFPKGKYNDQVDSMVQLLKRSFRVVSFAQQFKRSERKDIKSVNSSLKVTAFSIHANGRVFRF